MLYPFCSLFLLARSPQGDTIIRVHEMKIQARVVDQQIELRWAPTSREVWMHSNIQGYVLERKRNGERYEEVGVFRPYDLDEWKAKTDTTDVYVTIAAQCLLGKASHSTDPAEGFSQFIKIAEEQDNRFFYALMSAEFSSKAADGLALRYVDTDFQEGETIYYRVYAKDQDSEFSGDTAVFRVNTSLQFQPQQPTGLQANEGQNKIELQWPKGGNVQNFSAYHIERSENDGKKWDRLTVNPYMASLDPEDEEALLYTFSDTNVENYKMYKYRLIGVSMWAEEGLPGDPIEAMGRDLTPPSAPHTVVANDNNTGTILIEWQADEIEDDHVGFVVGTRYRTYRTIL